MPSFQHIVSVGGLLRPDPHGDWEVVMMMVAMEVMPGFRSRTQFPGKADEGDNDDGVEMMMAKDDL